MSDARPNVICILTDDQGIWAAGYRPHRFNRHPV